MNVEISVETSDVERLLTSAELALSPIGMKRFVDTWAADYFRERAKRSFDTESDPATGVWKPLGQAANNLREYDGFPPAHPINVRTGELRSWLVNSRGTSLVLGSTVEYWFPELIAPSGPAEAKLHTAQLGRPTGYNWLFPGHATPARPVTSITGGDVGAVLLGMVDHLYDTIRTGVPI